MHIVITHDTTSSNQHHWIAYIYGINSCLSRPWHTARRTYNVKIELDHLRVSILVSVYRLNADVTWMIVQCKKSKTSSVLAVDWTRWLFSSYEGVLGMADFIQVKRWRVFWLWNMKKVSFIMYYLFHYWLFSDFLLFEIIGRKFKGRMTKHLETFDYER